MGYSGSGGPKGLGVITDSNTPLSDLTKVIELIGRVGNYRGPLTEAERDAIAGAELYEGLLAYNLDTGVLEKYDGTGWVPASGVTQGSYTPTLSRAVVGNGTLQSVWSKSGDLVTVQGSFILGSTSSISAASGAATVGVSLPFPMASFYGVANTNFEVGNATLLDSTVQIYYGRVSAEASTTEVKLYAQALSGSYIGKSPVNAAAPFAWGTADSMSWLFNYVAA